MTIEAAAIDPRNGMTDDFIGMAGYMTFMTCHDEKPDWEKADKLTWTMAAKNVVELIATARAAEKDLPIQHLTAMVHQWLAPSAVVPFFELTAADKASFQAVAMFWANILRAENQVPVPDIAKGAVEWYKKKVAPPLEAAPNVMTGHAQQPSHNGNGKHDREYTTKLVGEPIYGQSRQVAQESTPSVGKGMSKSFHRLIDAKIYEYEAKLASLHDLKRKIGPDWDEALYEIIAPLLKEGD